MTKKLREDKYLPARLLAAKDQLSVLEQEKVLKDVLATTARNERATSSHPWILWRWSVVPVSAIGLVVIGFVVHGQLVATDELVARGGDESPWSMSVRCLHPDGGMLCQPGAKLVFQVMPPPGRGFFGSFGQATNGDLIWYFPASSEDKSVPIPSRTESSREPLVLPLGVRLGSEHPPGDYVVTGVFSSEPLSRSQLQRFAEEPIRDASSGHVIAIQRFRVELP